MSGKAQLDAASAGICYVEIDGTGIEQGRHYTDKASGLQKPLPGKQTGYIWQGGRYPITISVDIPEGKGPYRPGLYLFSGPMFESGKYGRVEFKGLRECQLVEMSIAADVLDALAKAESATPSKAA